MFVRLLFARIAFSGTNEFGHFADIRLTNSFSGLVFHCHYA